MSFVEHIDKKVSLRVEAREREESLFTEECLTATCIERATFQARHGREMKLSDCPESCPYHPVQNPPRRIRRVGP